MKNKKSTFLGALFLGLLLAVGIESVTVTKAVAADAQTMVARLPNSPGDDGPPVMSLS